jgi:hypothetical protein
VGPFPGRWLRLFLLPLFLQFLGRPSPDPLATSFSGAAERGAGISGGWGFLREDEGGARLYLGIFWQFLADRRLEAQCLLGVTTGLNNQRLGKSFTILTLKGRFQKYLEDEGSFGGFFR